MDLQKLTNDCVEARKLAINASEAATDGGSCNLDAVFLTLPKYHRSAKVIQAIRGAGLSAYDTKWYVRGVMISPPGSGQAGKRAASQNALYLSLRGAGWDVSPYYKMD